MLINLRNALMTGKRLPYDAEVEYIQFNGTSASRKYLDTGIKVADPSTIKVEAVADACLAQGFFHSFVGNGTMVCSYYTPGNSSVQVYSKDFNSRQLITPPSTTTSYVYDGASGFYINGTQQATFTASLGTDVIADISWRFGEFYDFYYSDGMGSTAYNRDGKLYSLKIYISGVLVRDYIPVRKGNVGYLYDRVSGKLFGNAGTGDFVVGQDVVPVEYIESHGTEYIDTGVPARTGLSTDIVCAITQAQNDTAVCGAKGTGNNRCVPVAFFSSDSTTALVYGTGNRDTDSIYAQCYPEVGRMVRYQSEISTGAISLNIDGTAYTRTTQTSTINAGTTLRMFAREWNGTISAYSKIRMASALFDLDGVRVRSFLPVRVGTEGAMMDVLTRRIYRNAGTGAFTYGNDLKYPIPA